MREVIFIQSKFPTSEQALETLLGRWESYAFKLKEIYGISSITVITPFQVFENNSRYAHLSFVSKSNNILSNILAMIRIVKSTKRPVTLICGDNQISLLVSLICRWLSSKMVLIQCQFHGDLYTFKNNPGIKGLLRVISSRFALRLADSIRIVSEFQRSELIKIAPKINKEFIVSPISIDYSKIPVERSSEIIYDIAVVGRLHEERGIENVILIIKEIVKRRSMTKIAFIGEGKCVESVTQKLAKELRHGSVALLGAVTSKRLRDVYSSSKILLSAAPREGYGLALREACLSGMVVIAKNSEGAREAKHYYPGSIQLFESVEEAATQVLQELDNFSEKTNRAELIKIQKQKDDENLKNLLENWVKP